MDGGADTVNLVGDVALALEDCPVDPPLGGDVERIGGRIHGLAAGEHAGGVDDVEPPVQVDGDDVEHVETRELGGMRRTAAFEEVALGDDVSVSVRGDEVGDPVVDGGVADDVLVRFEGLAFCT